MNEFTMDLVLVVGLIAAAAFIMVVAAWFQRNREHGRRQDRLSKPFKRARDARGGGTLFGRSEI